MLGRRKIKKVDVDRQLLQSIFVVEAEWKKMRKSAEHSYDVDEITENKQLILLKQAKYMFLLQEAKHRKLNALTY